MNGNVRYVKNIRIIKHENEPDLMAVKAIGVAVINNLINPVLVPKKYTEAPSDGILELDFILLPYGDDIPDVEMEVDVILKLKNLPPWVKGLKINASENSDIELI